MFINTWKKSDLMSMVSDLMNLLKIIYNDFDLKKDDKKKLEAQIRKKEIHLRLRKRELESELNTIDESIENAKGRADDILEKIKK